tara:strand:+ start:21344 stop:21964 length:621 start_codon:yes stop_codon:yes gene_type:complete
MLNLFALKVKSILDVFVSFLLILLLSPLFIICIAVIYFDDGFNPIFVQKRIGINGKSFKMYKFRTMRPNSEHIGSGYYCFEGDPRITKYGKLIRKYSLDELPQLFNVLKGDMSLIGPRPAILDEFEKENINDENIDKIYLRTIVKPGISGYSQVYSRNSIDWNKKLELDSRYLSYKPFKRIFIDLKIIFLTVSEIIFSKGVYDIRN